MKSVHWLLIVVALLHLTARASPKTPEVQRLPYCFIEESPGPLFFERLGHLTPIEPDTVLLFPVVEGGYINGRFVKFGVGSPLVYKQQTDIANLQFKGIGPNDITRCCVWARGYYMTSVPRVFLYTDTIRGQKCFIVELTPIKPGTDRRKMEAAIIGELKKGQIIVEPPVEIADKMDYTRLIRSGRLKSWVKVGSPLQTQRTKVTWAPIGAKVEILLTDGDVKLMENYLRGDEGAKP